MRSPMIHRYISQGLHGNESMAMLAIKLSRGHRVLITKLAAEIRLTLLFIPWSIHKSHPKLLSIFFSLGNLLVILMLTITNLYHSQAHQLNKSRLQSIHLWGRSQIPVTKLALALHGHKKTLPGQVNKPKRHLALNCA